MKLTRFGFNALVAVYLAPLVLIDVIGNMMFTGNQSEYFFYMAILNSCLVAYAIYQLSRPPTATITAAQQRVRNTNDDVVTFENLGAIEYIYCLILSAYSAANYFWLHSVNKEAVGLMAFATLVWSVMSIGIAVLSLIQFWHLKSGAIVELQKKVIQ